MTTPAARIHAALRNGRDAIRMDARHEHDLATEALRTSLACDESDGVIEVRRAAVREAAHGLALAYRDAPEYLRTF